ncbi:MAG: DUF1565 domain-containing protein, partial [Chitinispirillaceae bacterium]|nr:DUF1565 domain-containing protein [Chitinispirillaceae bacterium]
YYGGIGNINKDPLFIGIGDSPYKYRLSKNSPAINAGDPLFGATDTAGGMYYDLAGSLRLRDGRVDIGAFEYHSGRIYVDCAAIGNNSGVSWANAFRKLEDALMVAQDGDSIWVAKGTYYPSNISGFTINNKNNITIVGGFNGTENSINQRELRKNLTIISGDLGLKGKGYTSDNASNIFVIVNSNNITLDGLVIQNANLLFYEDSTKRGSGISAYNISGYLKIKNCDIRENTFREDGSVLYVNRCNKLEIITSKICENSFDVKSFKSLSTISLSNVNIAEIANSAIFGNKRREKELSLNRTNCYLTNSTFYSDSCKNTIKVDTSYIRVTNSIIYSPQTDTVFLLYKGKCTIDYSVIKGKGSQPFVWAPTRDTLNIDSTVWYFNPQIDSNSLTLKPSSPCINRGKNIDTTGWSKDLAGNLRIYNGKIDLGAYEFQGLETHNPPLILSTLSTFTIEAGKSITIELNKKNLDGSGYYVNYEYGNIEEVVWYVYPSSDSGISAIINPQNNQLTLSIANYVSPGTIFTLRIRVTDPDFPSVYNEKNIVVQVTSPGFEICRINITQDSLSRVFIGIIETKNSVTPIKLAANRIYLYNNDGTTRYSSTDSLYYIDSIIVIEQEKPYSRGGVKECGVYKFLINTLNTPVRKPNGLIVKNSLYEYATDTLNPYGYAYSKTGKLSFVLPVTNTIDRVDNRLISITADLSGPYTNSFIVAENNPYSQLLKWAPFNEELVSLWLKIEALEGDSVILSKERVLTEEERTNRTYLSDSLEDSRTYRYTLFAKDKKGNITATKLIKATPSDFYIISGRIKGVGVNLKTKVKIELIDSSNLVIKDTTVYIDSSYRFERVVNGKYTIKVIKDKYSVIPAETNVSVLRNNVTNIDFIVTPTPVVDTNSVIVSQLEGSGDLLFTFKTNQLFCSEVPTALKLVWQGQVFDEVVDSQIIKIYKYSYVNYPDGSALWKIIIPRDTIQKYILNRTRTFDYPVRYVNSSIITGFYSQVFREAKWSYPIVKDGILYANQNFKKPLPPYIGSTGKFGGAIEVSLGNTSLRLDNKVVI